MISKWIETALTDSQDRAASSGEQVQSTGDTLSLKALFSTKLKMVNSLRNTLYLTEEEYGMLNHPEELVKSKIMGHLTRFQMKKNMANM